MDEWYNTKKWFRERRWGRAFLYFELAYVVVLFLSAWFNFGLFAHLVVGQFIIITIYYLTGIIVGIYLKKAGKLPVDESEKESLRQKLAYRFNSRFFYHSLELLNLLLGIGVAVRAFSQAYVEFFSSNNSFDPIHAIVGYIGMAYFFFIMGMTISLLMSWRNGVRNCSFLTIITAVILLICLPAHWLNYLLGIVVAAVTLFLYYQNKL